MDKMCDISNIDGATGIPLTAPSPFEENPKSAIAQQKSIKNPPNAKRKKMHAKGPKKGK
jgi:hypothetical protein